MQQQETNWAILPHLELNASWVDQSVYYKIVTAEHTLWGTFYHEPDAEISLMQPPLISPF